MRAVACAVFLVSAAPAMGASTITPQADTGVLGISYVTFVGNYGETFTLKGGWTIDASTHGQTEVINQYPKFRSISKDLFEPFHPKPQDFIPENFSKDALIQLLVIPWSASSSKSLDELKKQKDADLRLSGVEFRIVDDPFPGQGHMGRKWPKGTFEVLILTPYKLSQLYTTSGAHLAILTSGFDTPPEYEIAPHYNWTRSGLRDWVVPETGAEVPETFGPVPARSEPEKGISFRVFRKPQIWLSWLLVNATACLVFGLLGIVKRGARLRSASLALLIFSNSGAAIGGLVGLCFWPFAWSALHLPFPSAVACLFMPLLAGLVGRVRRRQPRRRAMVATTAWALIASMFFVYVASFSTSMLGPEWSPHIPSFTAGTTFIAYAVAGIVFGLLDFLAKRKALDERYNHARD